MSELLASPVPASALAAVAVAIFVVGAYAYLRAPVPPRAVELLADQPGRRGAMLDPRVAVERSAIGRRLASDLRAAGMTMRSSSLLSVMAAILLVGWLVFHPAVGVVGALLPYLVIRRRAGQHAREFARQLPAVLDLIAGALRAGQNETQAFAVVADEMHGAAAEEFRRMERQLALGGTVEDVTQSLLERLPSADLELAVDAIQLSHRVGGNLAQMLADIAATIREHRRLEGEIRALTAQGRASVYMVTALAPLGLLAISFLNPPWGQLLFETTGGRIALGLVFALELVGYLLAQRMASVEV